MQRKIVPIDSSDSTNLSVGVAAKGRIMSEVFETPDISEDESFGGFDDSTSIVETSLIDEDQSSDAVLFGGNKNRKKAFIIESDTSSEEEAPNAELKSRNEICSKENSRASTSDHAEKDGEVEEQSHQTISAFSSPLLSSTLIVPDNAENNFEVNSSRMEQSYRNVVPLIPSRSPSPDFEDNVIPISSDDETDSLRMDETATVNQKFLKNVDAGSTEQDIQTKTKDCNLKNIDDFNLPKPREVTATEYETQIAKVQTLQFNVQKTKNIMRTVNMNGLPDKGSALIKKYENLLQEATEEEKKLNNMVISKETKLQPLKPLPWENLQAGLSAVQPRTFGRQALETLNIQKALTLDRLEQLHGSLKTCPDSNTFATDPQGLKVELMPHQKHAIAWLMWREKQKPSGGILADDMGLGKTLTMIALTLKASQHAEDENDETNPQRKNSKFPGKTLVVCPASLVYQWEAEVKKHVKKNLITVGLYHGSTRETRAKRLARLDMVITTYALAMGDYNKSGPLFEIKWRRIILDEAHQIRNHKSQTSVAACNLSATSRWVLTGTPVQNKELDLYALLKLLRCSPFDDLTVWKRWVANKGTGGQDRLNTVMSSLILRRTKQQLAEKKLLTCMPEKKWELVQIILEKQETDVYQKVLIFSRTLFAQFLHQRAEKMTDNLTEQQSLNNPNGEYYKMHQQLVKLNRVKKIKQHEILVLLLRLRQICCHTSLITNMLHGEENLDDSEIEGQEELNLLEQINKLNLNDIDQYQPTDVAAGLSTDTEGVGLAEASRNLLNPKNPIFAENRRSSKIKTIMKIIEELPDGDKVVVVSQWTKMLNLLAIQLKQDQIRYFQLDGSVQVHKRMEIVESINNPSNKVKILLLSLTAGGVGLNLIGANHLILTDLHWNPQLEIQAQDRIYRVGQSKPVKVYKLMAVDTIEQQIKQLQDKKLDIAEELLTGARIQHHNKLSLQDLKMLFNM